MASSSFPVIHHDINNRKNHENKTLGHCKALGILREYHHFPTQTRSHDQLVEKTAQGRVIEWNLDEEVDDTASYRRQDGSGVIVLGKADDAAADGGQDPPNRTFVVTEPWNNYKLI